eukprot:31362_1
MVEYKSIAMLYVSETPVIDRGSLHASFNINFSFLLNLWVTFIVMILGFSGSILYIMFQCCATADPGCMYRCHYYAILYRCQWIIEAVQIQWLCGLPMNVSSQLSTITIQTIEHFHSFDWFLHIDRCMISLCLFIRNSNRFYF